MPTLIAICRTLLSLLAAWMVATSYFSRDVIGVYFWGYGFIITGALTFYIVYRLLGMIPVFKPRKD